MLTISSLNPNENDTSITTIYIAQATLLAECFFPTPPADLFNIVDTTFNENIIRQKFEFSQRMECKKIEQILSSTDVWKISKLDNLFTNFFKACKRPLALLLTNLATASLVLKYYPQRFQNAETMVISKSGKSGPILYTPNIYKSIVLFNSMDKVVETAMYRYIAQTVEEQLLLPESQMDNRPGRSTELAI